jgi:casein kinase 1
MDLVLGGHYRIRRRIGSGSFGEIYSAEDTTSHRWVAVKLESNRVRVPQLAYEARLYEIFAGGTGIPRLFWSGPSDLCRGLAIELLGESLADLLAKCNRRLTVKSVLMLADQMISCVQFIHNKNFVLRDIKPENFVMGIGARASQVFVIDYGLAKKYRDQNTHAHIPYVEGKSLTGTARYASITALRGGEQSRRDDMEALGYVWVYLLKGSLPWMGAKGLTEEAKQARVCRMKSDTPIGELCRDLPEEFAKYLQIVRNLEFTEPPRYCELRALFRNRLVREGFVYDYKYDWATEAPRAKVPPAAGARSGRRARAVAGERQATPNRPAKAPRIAPAPSPRGTPK